MDGATADTLVSRRWLLRAAGAALAGLHGGVAAHSRRPFWPGGKRGAVSITYDDGLDTQLDTAIPQLDAAGMRGTFFVTTEQITGRIEGWRRAAAHGHELANHSVDHPCDLKPWQPEAYMAREIAPAERLIERIAGPAHARLFAYPCDVTNLGPGSANEQARRFARLLRAEGIVAARTSEGEPNNPRRVPRRLYRLQALALGYDAPDLGAVTDYLDTAVDKGFWAILVVHNIRAARQVEGDISPAFHRGVLEAIAVRDLYCAPMGQALSHLMEQHD